jgi:PPOX class probable F420-dependent enzyme
MVRPVATNIPVDRAGLVEFMRPRHQAILATQRADGTPQLSPVTMGVDPEGAIVIATYPERAKAVNVRLRPTATVCVLSDTFNGEWVQVTGVATVVDVPDALDDLVTYFRSISGEHQDWDEYRQAMMDQGKSLIRVVPERWGPISKGGFPPQPVG